jgi:hypothetical protein
MDTPTNRFKSPTGGKYLRALFFETTGVDKSTVLYTLKDQEHLGYPSLYQLYMAANDPTEWRFATQHLDGWEHWEQLTACTWFIPYAARWRRELHLRTASESLARVMAEAKTNSRDSFTANRYLIERGWEPKGSSKGGRPTKDSIRAAAHQLASESHQIDSDFNRILNKELQ